MFPALIYASINVSDPVGIRGWAIPTATDAVLALGVLSLLGRRVPPGLKIFLMALAIFDDIGAVLVIGVFYAQGISAPGLVAAVHEHPRPARPSFVLHAYGRPATAGRAFFGDERDRCREPMARLPGLEQGPPGGLTASSRQLLLGVVDDVLHHRCIHCRGFSFVSMSAASLRPPATSPACRPLPV